MAFTDETLITAHKHCTANKEEILASNECGCFYCLQIFKPNEITEWININNKSPATAFCPHCFIDAVLGSHSGYPITPKFLKAMQRHWFDNN